MTPFRSADRRLGSAIAGCGLLLVAAVSVAADDPRERMIPSVTLFADVTGPSAEQQVYYDLTVPTEQLLTAAVKFQDDKTTQKITFAPMKLTPNCTRPVLCDWVVGLTQAKGVLTSGVAFQLNTASTQGGRARRIWSRQLDKITPPTPLPWEADSAAEKAFVQKQLVEGAYASLFEDLATGAFKVSLTANVQHFSVFSSDPVDLNDDGVIDNKYGFKGWDIAPGIAYSFSPRASVGAAAHYGKRRAAPSASNVLAVYRGFSVTAAWRLAVLNPEYKETEDFRKSLFIPSVVLGAAVEVLRCDGEGVMCEDTVTKQTVVTPFVDFRISPGAQFRLGVPWTSSTQLTKSKAVAAFAQFAIQISALK